MSEIETAHMDNAQQFRAEWSRYYGALPPLAWMLRPDPSLPWTRFHGLPNAKQYTDNDRERAISLERANTIGTGLLGDGAPCWLIHGAVGEDALAEVSLEWQDKDGDEDGTEDETEDPDARWLFSAQKVIWRANAFDAQLAVIAEDDGCPVLWMARDTGALFAPYPGGFDVFPRSWPEVERLKGTWPDWLASTIPPR